MLLRRPLNSGLTVAYKEEKEARSCLRTESDKACSGANRTYDVVISSDFLKLSDPNSKTGKRYVVNDRTSGDAGRSACVNIASVSYTHLTLPTKRIV